jgi:cytochrome P450
MMAAVTPGKTSTLDELDIHTISAYEEHGYPWVAWDRLREEAPCYWYDRDGIAPFWAITRHSDVKSLGSNSSAFVNGGGRLRIKSRDIDDRYAAAREKKLALYDWDSMVPEDMVFLDNPAHHEMRQLTVRHFTPARCRDMASELADNAANITEEFAARLERGETPDLIHDFAVALPLMTIASMMGVERDDWADIHRWTDAMFDNNSMRFALPGEER